MATLPKDIKQFNWTSEIGARGEYDEWEALLKRHLGGNKALFCLTPEGMKSRRPKMPMARPEDTATDEVKAEYRRYRAKHEESLIVFYDRCDIAMGILRSTFKFDCKASHDLERAYANIPLKDDGKTPLYHEDQWTADKRFSEALKALKAYAPQDTADVAHLRKQLSDLKDDQGFYSYFQEFTRKLGALDRAGARPSDSELTEWVKAGIQNDVVNNFMATAVITIADPSPTYEVIFNKIEFYLKTRGEDRDPYKLVKTQTGTTLVSSKATAMAVSRNSVRKEQQEDLKPRCTRCWNKGHAWADCKAKTCSACKTPIEGLKYCPRYQTHTEKATRFVPRKILDNTEDVGKSVENTDAAATSTQINDLKRKLSALQASLAAKRLKTSEESKKG